MKLFKRRRDQLVAGDWVSKIFGQMKFVGYDAPAEGLDRLAGILGYFYSLDTRLDQVGDSIYEHFQRDQAADIWTQLHLFESQQPKPRQTVINYATEQAAFFNTDYLYNSGRKSKTIM